MVLSKSFRREWVVAVCAALLAFLLLVLAGCSKPETPAPKATGATAKDGLGVARSALSTMAPDAKLLLVQTAESVSSTATPVWAYLYGSPKTDKTYVVYVTRGKAMQASEYATAGLEPAEWAAVPGTDSWQVDSDAAYQKAIETGSVKKPDTYQMGLITYVPKSDAASSTTKAFNWYVALQSGNATAAVEVDAKTGKASPVK